MAVETEAQKKIRLALSAATPAVLFRNNTGMGWIGRQVHKTGTSITLEDCRPLHAGLTKGSSDLIGWTKVEITPDMVGKTVAVFTAVECKASRGKASEEQVNFLNVVNKSGGIAGIAKNEQEAINLVNRMF